MERVACMCSTRNRYKILVGVPNLGDRGIGGRMIIKQTLRNSRGRNEVAVSCDHVNKPSSFITGGEL